MSFRAIARCEAAWRTWEGGGLQRVVLWQGPGADQAIVAEGAAVVAGPDGYAARFRVDCDTAWRVRFARIRIAGGAALELHADGDGRWRDGNGTELAAFSGCIDIDLQASPLTNVLPIRRTGFTAGQAREFRMVYVAFPSLDIFVDEQRYTCIEPCRRYLYEAVDGSFSAELPVDEDGLVLDYPGLFRRVAS
ncbi:putative glycolipid-binding domain-containing protein [Microbaculum marinum]|uniref:Glycolipid-binding domain-containing protein n=1 Tax=Microbaculum marinum TaxID=1764581 RepID=A0AAW9RUI2_9HYPH